MKKKKFNDSEKWFSLIPELNNWNKGQGINHESWIEIEGKLEYALAYTSIFWPEFIMYKDCIFIEGIDDQTYDTWFEHCKGNRKSMEATINHRHLDLWFHNDYSEEQIEYFGSVLKDMWETKLLRQFPDKKVIVELTNSMGEYTIKVYQDEHQ